MVCPNFLSLADFRQDYQGRHFNLIALDRITNPQNLGMIIRSVAAGFMDGLLLPEKGCAKLDALVIKASAGTLFKCPIIRCDKLVSSLKTLQKDGAAICGLSSHAQQNLGEFKPEGSAIYVMGNETEGVAKEVEAVCDQWLSVPMNNGVESLNVAVTASLIAFKPLFKA